MLIMGTSPQEDGEGGGGGQFYRALEDLKFSPTPRGLSPLFFGRGAVGWVGLGRKKKFVCLFQVKFNFSIDNIFFRVVSWHQKCIDL